MACPVCGQMYCFHSPADRGQTPREIFQEIIRDFECVKKALHEKAREFISRGGEKNYKKALELVGPKEAKKIHDEINHT